MSEAALIQAGVQHIGSVIGGIGAFAASRGRAKALKAGAKQAKREAGIEAGMALAEGDRAAAQAAVSAAAGGGGLTGSALASLDDLAGQAMFNARRAIYEGVSEARNLEYEAKVAKKQGTLALVMSQFDSAPAVGTALGDMQQKREQKRLALQQSSVSRQPAGFSLNGLY